MLPPTHEITITSTDPITANIITSGSSIVYTQVGAVPPQAHSDLAVTDPVKFVVSFTLINHPQFGIV